MAVVAPFRALRPVPSTAARVAAVPYDVVNGAEARALARDEPLSFLRVSRADADLPPDTPPYSDEVYARAATNMATLAREAPFVREDSPSIYLYRLELDSHAQTGVAACFSLDEYEQGVIRRHERTRKEKEDDRTRHILALRAQTGPAFLIHRPSHAIRELVAQAAREAPLFDFEAPDGVRHVVWRVSERHAADLVAAFRDIPALYIADGHHRAAAAARARREMGQSGDAAAADAFLAVAFQADEVRVLPYNRIVKTLGPWSPDGFLDALRARMDVREGPPAPARRGEVSMFLDGRWHRLVLGTVPAGASPADCLDVSRLQRDVLAPLLGIEDVTTDSRIDFVGGVRGTAALERLVRDGEAAVAFSMFPVSTEDIMQISDAGGIMPPKSTWFEPKLRDGLLIHSI